MFYCLNVQLYHLCDKRWFVCAHIRQKQDIYPPSIFRLHFDSWPLPLFRRLTMGAAIEKNFFWFLFFWFSLVSLRSLDWNYFFEFYTRYSYLDFFYFSDFVIILVWFWLSNYRLIVSISNISIFTRFAMRDYLLRLV